MALNFKGGPPKPPTAKPTDPIKIFEARPAISSQINDLWRGQAQALTRWYEATENDILVALNTGAGKSVVGVLICQSLLNQRVQNPVYLCPTNDLVEQTAAEARKLSLDFTTRTSGDFSNEKFETGNGFLITSYQTLLNARTRLRGDLAPKGIVFDDAHVGEPTVRGQFTLRINRRRHADIHAPLQEALLGLLSPTDRQQVRFILESQSTSASFLCPPETGQQLSETLLALARRFDADGYADVSFPHLHLAQHWHACAVVVNREDIEISPPFLPTRTLPPFRDADVRRTYLSATLKSESEFVRAYGRPPGLRIEPEVDAGNGERSIINVRKLKDGPGLVDWAQRQSRRGKVLVAVPSRPRAAAWEPVAKVSTREDFIERLNAFRAAPQGGFVLAGRFDGIDLPDTTCRLMIIAGLPAGGTLLETYLWQSLEMQNLLAARVATRVTQLFGRIIRGRNDYGFFILQGTDLTNWLSRDRNVALLPELLQKQIKLGQELQDDFSIDKFVTVDEFLKQVLDRDPDWLSYYRQYIDALPLDTLDVEKRRKNEEAQMRSAVAEARFAEALWQRRHADAIQVLENIIDDTATADSRLAGWLNLWVGAAYALNGNTPGAQQHYAIARSRLPLSMTLPVDAEAQASHVGEGARAGDRALRHLVAMNQRAFTRETDKALKLITTGIGVAATSSMSEEAYRTAGILLGFDATRPDNDHGAGPDVLWVDPDEKTAVSFELKTEKAAGSSLTKKEIGQSHNHVQWIADTLPSVRLLQHFLVGENLLVADNANPDPDWCLNEPHALLTVVQKFVEDASRIRRFKDEAIARALRSAGDEGTWSLEAVAEQLTVRKLEP